MQNHNFFTSVFPCIISIKQIKSIRPDLIPKSINSINSRIAKVREGAKLPSGGDRRLPPPRQKAVRKYNNLADTIRKIPTRKPKLGKEARLKKIETNVKFNGKQPKGVYEGHRNPVLSKPQAKAIAKFLNTLDKKNKLTKTIIYNLNPADNEVFATMIGNFNDGSSAGKVQWGSSWWFLDQKDGMTKQLNALSNMGLLSKFVGMLTDSRSFLSFPRHEYFRRILCNIFGEEIENGEMPNDLKWTGKIIQDICFNNAKQYFNW